MSIKDFQCVRCGHCCRFADAYATTVDEDDILMWERAGRWDIIDWVETIEEEDGTYTNEIRFHPRTREEVRRCPWLRKRPRREAYICRIHDLKPRHCRDYPLSEDHARSTGCRGLPADSRSIRPDQQFS